MLLVLARGSPPRLRPPEALGLAALAAGLALFNLFVIEGVRETVLETYLSGGESGPWTYRVELVDERGRVLERWSASSLDEAAVIADSLRRATPRPRAAAGPNGLGPGR